MPIEVRATSGRAVEVVSVPAVGGRCHFDRRYVFHSLGSFDKSGERMLYVMTPNDDRHTPATSVMWVVSSDQPFAVHLNYRSEEHLTRGGQEGWLRTAGFARNAAMTSTTSSGEPRGPYTGPVYTKQCESGKVELHGSQYWEGTYFVFVELLNRTSDVLNRTQGTPPPSAPAFAPTAPPPA